MATIMTPQQEDEKKAETSAPGSVAQASSLTGATAQANAQQAQRQGSGRFTNLQKYLDANKQAGQQIAGQVGGKLQGDISEKKGQAQDYYSKLGESVSKAKDVAGQGGDFMKQLQGIGSNIQAAQEAGYGQQPQQFGIQQFTQSPQFGQFQNIQAGRGIDERLLAAQQADAARSAQAYQQASQQALQGLGSEGGRFDLLKKTFGGNVNPQYSTGSQRLDQLFLARQGLGGLQEQISEDLKAAKGLSRQATQSGAEVGNIAKQERQLMQDIASQAGANEQAYIDMLGSYVPEIQQQRDADWQALQSAIQDYQQPAEGQVGHFGMRPDAGLSAEQLQRLGVNRQYGAFDVMENLTGAEDVAVKGRAAQDYRDAATQADVDRYAALANIAGISPDRLTQAADLGETYTAREGDASLSDRLQRAQAAFDELAGQTTFDHQAGGRRGKDFWTGKGKRYGGRASGTASDLLSRGQEGIAQSTYGDTSGGWGTREMEQSADKVWEDFKNFLNEQNYSRTIGAPTGGKGAIPGGLYGRREAAGLVAEDPLAPGTTVKLGATPGEKRYK